LTAFIDEIYANMAESDQEYRRQMEQGLISRELYETFHRESVEAGWLQEGEKELGEGGGGEG
jgi:hypothetical protein